MGYCHSHELEIIGDKKTIDTEIIQSWVLEELVSWGYISETREELEYSDLINLSSAYPNLIFKYKFIPDRELDDNDEVIMCKNGRTILEMRTEKVWNVEEMNPSTLGEAIECLSMVGRGISSYYMESVEEPNTYTKVFTNKIHDKLEEIVLYSYDAKNKDKYKKLEESLFYTFYKDKNVAVFYPERSKKTLEETQPKTLGELLDLANREGYETEGYFVYCENINKGEAPSLEAKITKDISWEEQFPIKDGKIKMIWEAVSVFPDGNEEPYSYHNDNLFHYEGKGYIFCIDR